jgi:hypothetical protein
LVEFAEPRIDQLGRLRPECSIDVFCGIFSGDHAQGGFEFEPALMLRLADLELAVVFDIY